MPHDPVSREQVTARKPVAKPVQPSQDEEAKQVEAIKRVWFTASERARRKFMKEVGLVMPATEALTKLKSKFVPASEAKRKAAWAW